MSAGAHYDPSMLISPRYRARHWVEFTCFADSRPKPTLTEKEWKAAIRIFDDRFRGRFFSPVKKIATDEFSGFATVALDCLLIETLQQFRNGVPETPNGESANYFRAVLTEMSSAFDARTGGMFYDQFRCGILHQAETKKESLIRIYGPVVQTTATGKGLIINRREFHRELRRVFSKYLRDLRSGRDANLRAKFRTKMNYICRLT